MMLVDSLSLKGYSQGVIVRFAKKVLQECAELESLSIRTWGPIVGPRYPRRIIVLEETTSFSHLFAMNSLRLHKLAGQSNDLYAITLHDRWRIIIKKISETEVSIEEVSNHYGD